MGKTNYTKVEEALTEGMRKIEVDRLLNAADENAAANQENSGKESSIKIDPDNQKLLITIHHELKSLDKQGKDPYKHLTIDKAEIKKFINNSAQLTPEDWGKLKSIKEKINAYKLEIDKNTYKSSDEDLIKSEIKIHSTKRFNINKKWIPLQ